MRKYAVQKTARTGTTIFTLERHVSHDCFDSGIAVASADESADVEARVFTLETHGEVHGDRVTSLAVIDVLNNVCNHLEVLSGQCPLLCWGRLNYRHG